MSLHTIDGTTPQFDFRHDRIGAGTIGGEHFIPRGASGAAVASIVDDADPAITYGFAPGYSSDGFSIFTALGFTQFGTQTVLGSTVASGVEGSAATYKFHGSSIGVLAGTNPFSGVLHVLIDGVATAGRTLNSISLHTPNAMNTPAVGIADVTVTTLTIPATFPASGTILIGNELIDYSSYTGGVFTVSARGAHGTVAQNHYTDETVYGWDSTSDLGTAYSNKRLVWYNPFLTPGDHTITIYNTIGSTTFAGIYFDGFITGSLVGASNLFTQTGTLTGSAIFDVNGHCDVGSLVSNNGDVSIISILGYTQSNTQTTNTTPLAQLGVYYTQSGAPFYYFHNGPPSSTVTMTFSFMYIGETL